MYSSPTDEQRELQGSLRRLLADIASEDAVRRAIADGYDDATWKAFRELGLPGIAIPEEFGGEGLGPQDLAIVMTEMGRVLAPSPFFATTCLASNALMAMGDEPQLRITLPTLAMGDATAALAVAEPGGGWGGAEVQTLAHMRSGRPHLSGAKRAVPDGGTADMMFVVARGPDGVGLFRVDSEAAGVTISPLPTLDPTRPLADIQLDGAPAEAMGSGDRSADLHEAMATAALCLAGEMLGGADRCLEMAVEYAKVREQFDRPIGSFQAVKHRCADMLVAVEFTRAAVAYAAWAIAEEANDPFAVPVAVSQAAETFTMCAASSIQIHGGIGFTWDHAAHLYYRRAVSSAKLLGDASRHVESIAAELLR